MRSLQSFNEAEARVPRKIALCDQALRAIELASMRPRHACLGKYLQREWEAQEAELLQ